MRGATVATRVNLLVWLAGAGHMKNDLCTDCGGKGYYWNVDKMADPSGRHIADVYRQGRTCTHCGGSGRNRLNPWVWVVLLVAALVATAFVIQPVLHLLFDSPR
jgi:hypothetical protein